MKRRQLLACAPLACAPLVWAMPLTAARAAGYDTQEYSREAYEKALESGEPFMLDFFATW